ncbi:MAG: rRNA pseudouridine synthase [Candidatus Krumholzibacteriota bacterium]|nr:rRNA pseudouridine synthase [Candidatus Krumholzibacteriota bacterium]
MRINRFLAQAGLGSRRKCENLIKRGNVRLNGVRIEELSALVDPASDRVEVNGETIQPPGRTVVLVLNKPAGVICTVKDDHNRETVVDLAVKNGYKERLFPVGRLDLETTGIILLTNDGELAYRLTHPRFKIEKTYLATVAGRVGEKTINLLRQGVTLEDYQTSPCRITVRERKEKETKLELKIKEGKKRQIRKMFAAFDHQVLKLHRSALGELTFADVEPGEMRALTVREQEILRKETGLI